MANKLKFFYGTKLELKLLESKCIWAPCCVNLNEGNGQREKGKGQDNERWRETQRVKRKIDGGNIPCLRNQ